MDDSHETPPEHAPALDSEGAPWRLRPLLLALLGLASGIAVHLLLLDTNEDSITAATLAMLTLVTIVPAMIGFTIERRLWPASIAFAVVAGVIAAAVIYWNGAPGPEGGADGWRAVSLLLALAIAAPLFQAARDSERLRFPYSAVHDHAWTNVVLWCACWVFVGIVFAMAWLLSALFGLIGIDLLSDLLRKDWFWRALIGLSFGAALGLLREHGAVVRLLQRVVATVLAVLAPVLAIGLLLFLVSLPFTGLQALWDATDAATPILLTCVIGALILANAVIGDVPEHESRFPLMRFGAIALAFVVLPLAALAAIATGLRIGQYGFTPERLWAVTFVGIAVLTGLGYWWSLLRGRLDWEAVVRPVNLRLAMAVCLIALVLATPIVSFNVISTRDQVARLESGRIAPDKFDWQALRFEFGEPGRKALDRLATSDNASVAELARTARASTLRWEFGERVTRVETADKLRGHVRVVPAQIALPEGLLEAFSSLPDDPKRVVVHYRAGEAAAVLIASPCENCPINVAEARLGSDGKWKVEGPMFGGSVTEVRGVERDARATERQAGTLPTAPVEIRTVQRRQAFVGGEPVGEAFE